MELVSCIMATKDRPEFARQALRCFLRQTYSPAELIVIDDGKESVEGVFSCQMATESAVGPGTGATSRIGTSGLNRSTSLLELRDDVFWNPEGRWLLPCGARRGEGE